MAVVYWITGLSGVGKTTIGWLLYQRIKEKNPAVAFLDGDTLREVFGGDLGYTEADRRRSAMRNARLCALLAGQGLDVVCCTISMFEDVREWNRRNIPGYCEIYVKASMQTLKARNQKGLYTGARQDVAGINFDVEEPSRPDISLDNDGGKTPQEQVEAIEAYIKKQKQLAYSLH